MKSHLFTQLMQVFDVIDNDFAHSEEDQLNFLGAFVHTCLLTQACKQQDVQPSAYIRDTYSRWFDNLQEHFKMMSENPNSDWKISFVKHKNGTYAFKYIKLENP